MTNISELETFARALNASWLEQRWDDLAACFHEQVVIVTPDFSQIAGRDACVNGYRDFMTQATIHEFEVDDVKVHSIDRTAVLTVAYRIDYEIPTGRWRSAGREVLVAGLAGKHWQVIWRMLLPAPEEPVAGS